MDKSKHIGQKLEWERIRAALKKPVILIGMMGCGKSHAGSIIAKELSLPFYDSDNLIEEDQRCSISDIFANKGEDFFRRLEHDKISELTQKGVSVISTGGGCVTVPETLDIIKQEGISVWLKVDAKTLYERLKNTGNRPLIDCEDPQERLQELLRQRENLYARADIIIEDQGKGAPETAKEVIGGLGKYLRAVGAK